MVFKLYKTGENFALIFDIYDDVHSVYADFISDSVTVRFDIYKKDTPDDIEVSIDLSKVDNGISGRVLASFSSGDLEDLDLYRYEGRVVITESDVDYIVHGEVQLLILESGLVITDPLLETFENVDDIYDYSLLLVQQEYFRTNDELLNYILGSSQLLLGNYLLGGSDSYGY